MQALSQRKGIFMYDITEIQMRAHRPSNVVAINFRVDKSIREELDKYCIKHELGQSALLREIISSYLLQVGVESND
jgi:hypothetical protein